MIRKWDIVVIGSPSRNPYWGEPEDKPLRAPICTCTLVTGESFRLLVDPSYADAGRMAFELDRRCGLRPGDIDMVFLTHSHGDHTAGLRHFPKAMWLAGRAAAQALNASTLFSSRVEAAEEHLPPDIELVPSPGHAPGHHSLRFDWAGMSVVIAGDATLTRDFCRDGLSSFGAPTGEEKRTVQKLRNMADAMVPGHDNWFLCRV